MPCRLVTLPPGDALGPLARYIHRLGASGHWVMIVAGKVPAPVLQQAAAKAGVDPKRLFVADAVSHASGIPASSDLKEALFIAAPTLLETLQLRAEKAVWSHGEGRTHIIVHDLNTFSLYSPPEAIEQMVRYLMTRVRPYTVVDLLMDPATPLPPRLSAFLESFCDERVGLSALLQAP